MHLLLLLAACSSMRGADIDPPPPTGDGSYRPSWDPPSIHAEVDFAADDASGAFYLTPHMEDGRLTGSIRRIWPGPVNESVRIDHLFHAECGDGLVGHLIFSDGSVTEGGVTLTPNVGPELQLVATEPRTWALILPVRFEVEDVSDMGCGDRYEGEVLETTFNVQVDLPVPKPAVGRPVSSWSTAAPFRSASPTLHTRPCGSMEQSRSKHEGAPRSVSSGAPATCRS